MVICINQHLSNTDAELKKSVAYKKKRVIDVIDQKECEI